MKSVDMVSILYVVDLKSLYLNSGVYAYATWLSELKQDLNTYASLSYYVRSKFRRVLGGSERRLILSKLLNACKDFFITREIESFFPFLNFEYSPGILGANQPQFQSIFSDALAECADRIRQALPRLGYLDSITFNSPIGTTSALAAADYVADRRSGFDYIITSIPTAGAANVVRGDLSSRMVELQNESIINASLIPGYTVELMTPADSYPFVKFTIGFDTPSDSRQLKEEGEMIIKQLENNQPINIKVRMRDGDTQVVGAKIITFRGNFFMIGDAQLAPAIARVDVGEFAMTNNPTRFYTIYKIEQGKRLTDIPIEVTSSFIN
jgi:hypothetical protein